MTAKNCLLCGRPLARIRVGAGGDFCSREHRNQYRLRRGMDCLNEANKVSTLARRRENPKTLFGKAAPGISNMAPHGFLEAPSVMLSATGRPAAPKPMDMRNPGDRFTRAGVAPLQRPCAGSSGGPRAFGMKTPTPGRLAVRRRTANPAAARQASPASQPPKLREVAPVASVGNAYRVSTRVAFRQPAAGAARRAFPVAARTGRPAAGGLPVAPGQPQLLTFAPVSVTMRANSRLGYAAMGFTGAPDAPAPAEWVGLVLRKGLGREGRIS